jgi:signal transduction histidine kinase/HAMP domain-containing protein
MLAREGQAARPRRRTPQLFWKYVGIIVLLVSGALVTSSLVELHFTSVQIREAQGELLRQEAGDAAGRIDQFVLEIHRQIEWALQPVPLAGSEAEQERLVGYLSLLRLVPPITELSHLDDAGIERLRVSRLTMNVVNSGVDFSRDDRFVRPAAEPYFSAMYLRDRYEPYMTIAVREQGARPGVTVAEVNLTYVRDVIDRIKIGKTGRAFVVDEQGQLVAHDDINLMYQRLNLSSCPRVAAALGREASAAPGLPRDACRPGALSAHAMIEPLHWSVIAEQPEQEALAPLYGSVVRTAILLLCGLVLSALASLLLARAMVRPIRTLQQAAARIRAGDLEQRIDLHTGDELEALAAEFNSMSAQLREERATLERQVEVRTRDLTEALGERDESLKRQTAISEVLRIIAGSPSDRQAVLEAVAEKAASLCEANGSSIWLREGNALRRVAGYGTFAAEVGVERTINRDSITGRAAAEAKTIHVENLDEVDAAEYAESERRLHGHRSALSTPALREGRAIAVISLGREQAQPFTEPQIEMLETFADQVRIALELTRLFEEVEVASRHKSEFLAKTSHGLRTPLSALQLITRNILDGFVAPEDLPDRLRRIDRSVDHLLVLSKQLLELASIERGKLVLELAPEDLGEIAQSVCEALEDLAAEKRLRLLSCIQPDLPACVCDQERIREVLTNLVHNAIKFTEAGKILVAVCRSDAGVSCSVLDSGPGIAAENQHKVFDAFYQVTGMSPSGHEGAGLGLPIAKGIVEQHGGKIWIESLPGQGATIGFSLPLREGRPTP